jgi:hypothetical protein
MLALDGFRDSSSSLKANRLVFARYVSRAIATRHNLDRRSLLDYDPLTMSLQYG